jgi:hypothetical protein
MAKTLRGQAFEGLRRSETYEEMIDYIQHGQDVIVYPNRKARQTRESPWLTQLDGEGISEMEQQRGNQMKEQMKQAYISSYAVSTNQSRAEVEAAQAITASQAEQPQDWTENSGLQPPQDWTEIEATSSSGRPPPPPPGGASAIRQASNPVVNTVESVAAAVMNQAYHRVSFGGSSGSGNPPQPPPAQTLATASRSDVKGEDIGSKAVEIQIREQEEKEGMAKRAAQKVLGVAVDLGSRLGETHDLVGQKLKQFAATQLRSAAEDMRVFMNRQHHVNTVDNNSDVVQRLREQVEQEDLEKLRRTQDGRAEKAAAAEARRAVKKSEAQAKKAEQALASSMDATTRKGKGSKIDTPPRKTNPGHEPRTIANMGLSPLKGKTVSRADSPQPRNQGSSSSSSAAIVPFIGADTAAIVKKTLKNVGYGAVRSARSYLDRRAGMGLI